MEESKHNVWKKFLTGYQLFSCIGCYSVTAFSVFLTPTRLGYKPYGKPDNRILEEDDPFGWKISEMEEEYELKPGIEYYSIYEKFRNLGGNNHAAYTGLE